MENMYAKHSIRYENLESYLYGLSVIEGNTVWSWTDCMDMFNKLGVPSAPILWRGIAIEQSLMELAESIDPKTQEGYVVRTAASFSVDDFSKNVAKYVRQNHVQTDEHWTRNWVPNKLA